MLQQTMQALKWRFVTKTNLQQIVMTRGMKKLPINKTQFFATPKRRSAMRLNAMAVGAFGYFAVYVVPNVSFDYVLSFYTSNPRGMPPMSSKIQDLCQKVQADVGINDKQIVNYKMSFDVNEPYGWGFDKKTPQSALVILPDFFQVENPSNIDVSKRRLGQTLSRDKLNECISLSEKAKSFAVAKELTRCRNSAYFHPAYVGVFFWIPTVYLTKYLNDLLKTFSGNRLMLRLFLYALMALLHLGLSQYAINEVHNSVEKDLDDTVARLNLDYAKGGAEYYHKLSQLLEGQNSDSFLKTVPLKERGDACQKIIALHHAGLN